MKKVVFLTSLCLIFVFNEAQNYQWAMGFGSTKYDFGQILTTDSIGNVYAVGTVQDSADLDPGIGVHKACGSIFILKLDSSGNFVWAKHVTGGIIINPSTITLDKNGNIFILGAFVGTIDIDPGPGVVNLSSFGNGYSGFALKLDNSGNYIWVKTVGEYFSNAGFSSLAFDFSNNIYITGNFDGSVDLDPNAGVFNVTTSPSSIQDGFIVKLDSVGNFIWAKTIGGYGKTWYAPISFHNGFIYVAGGFSHTIDLDPGPTVFNANYVGSYDSFFSKLDSSGNLIWAKVIGGTGNEPISSLQLDNSGNIYISGNYEATVDFDPGPNVYSLTSSGQSDIFISKLDSSGNFNWVKTIGSIDHDNSTCSVLDNSANLYVAGLFKTGTVDFNPGAGVNNLTAIGWSDMFVLKLDSAGKFIWAKAMTGKNGLSVSYANCISLDRENNIYTIGGFMDTVDFNPDAATFNLISHGHYDIFISKLGRCNTLLPASFNTTICSNESTTLSATGAYSYTWMPGGVNTSSLSVNPNSTVIYTVSGTKSSDCEGSALITVTVDECTNIKENFSASGFLSAYPNPNNGEFTIKSSESLTINLTNEMGQNLRSMSLNDKNNYSVSVSGLSNGIYFIFCNKGSRKIVVNK